MCVGMLGTLMAVMHTDGTLSSAKSDFKKSHIERSDFKKSDFKRSYFKKGYFKMSYFKKGYFKRSYFKRPLCTFEAISKSTLGIIDAPTRDVTIELILE